MTRLMKALVLETYGTDLRLADLPKPVPGPDEVLVRIAASGVNPLDTKIRAGIAGHAQHPLPAILGIDMAGTVESVGTGITRFQPGDEVYGMIGGVGGVQGSLASHVAVDADLLAHKPKALSMREAAALPLAVITAWEGLVDRAHVAAGQSVLVQGGAGGVGHIAVQLAGALGARIFATARQADAPTIQALGATAIDFEARSVESYVAQHTSGIGFDVVYDTVGGVGLDASFRAVRRFGHVVSALGWGTHDLAPLSRKAASYSGIFTLLPLLTGEGRAHHGEILAEAARLADAGLIRPILDPRPFALADIEAAHRAVALGKNAGKVVISVEGVR